MQSSKGKFNCRERLEGLSEVIQCPLCLFAAPKISSAFRWLGDCVFDAKKNLQPRLWCRKGFWLLIKFPMRLMLFCRLPRLPTDSSEHRIKLHHPTAGLGSKAHFKQKEFFHGKESYATFWENQISKSFLWKTFIESNSLKQFCTR